MHANLLDSLRADVIRYIRLTEKEFAEGVIDDFNRALEEAEKPVSVARRWLSVYTGMKQ